MTKTRRIVTVIGLALASAVLNLPAGLSGASEEGPDLPNGFRRAVRLLQAADDLSTGSACRDYRTVFDARGIECQAVAPSDWVSSNTIGIGGIGA